MQDRTGLHEQLRRAVPGRLRVVLCEQHLLPVEHNLPPGDQLFERRQLFEQRQLFERRRGHGPRRRTTLKPAPDAEAQRRGGDETAPDCKQAPSRGGGTLSPRDEALPPRG
jgi:hypothetical protein